MASTSTVAFSVVGTGRPGSEKKCPCSCQLRILQVWHTVQLGNKPGPTNKVDPWCQGDMAGSLTCLKTLRLVSALRVLHAGVRTGLSMP